ncbi:DUF4248 domain-containing protein [uncultured Bacteroides sp.]|uniref:DUF4248 domain-containing protein n=1 Tax=uncultured Bacteroides sp. TaxID=162156 RepID=UPI002AAAE651|nr:DUF4248 domain-containing protein [uncultured Bacteroides sp.]
MMDENFELRSYSKTELSRKYNPLLCDRSAQRTLIKWIERNRELSERLLSTGFSKMDRLFTPRQVELIVSFLGEP